MFRGGFQVINMRWRVQKLVFPTASDMIEQKNQLKSATQRKKYSKTAVKVEKKWQLLGKIYSQDNVNHMEEDGLDDIGEEKSQRWCQQQDLQSAEYQSPHIPYSDFFQLIYFLIALKDTW